ncbi:MAG: hypothetical protein RSD40_06550 [Bacilli bacterium]
MIYEATHNDFIEILAKNEQAVFFFYSLEDKNSVTVKKTNTELKKIAQETETNIHLFITDKDDKTKLFSEFLELDSIPTIVVYKNGTFNRYKNKDFGAASIKKFIGSGKSKSKQLEHIEE